MSFRMFSCFCQLMKFLRTIAVSTLTLLSMFGCKNIPTYTSDFEQANKQITGISLNDETTDQIGQRFVAAFHTMGTTNFVKNAGQLYADNLYINDTLSQFSNKKE